MGCCGGIIYHYKYKSVSTESTERPRKQSHTALTIKTHSDGTANENDSFDATSVYTKSISPRSENKNIKLKHYQDAQYRITSGAFLQNEFEPSLNSEELYVEVGKKCALTTETFGDCQSDQMSELTSLSSMISLASPEGDIEHKQQYQTQRKHTSKSAISKKSEGGKKTKRYLDEMKNEQHDQYEEYVVNDHCIPFIDVQNCFENEDECKSIHHQTIKTHKMQKQIKNEERKRKKDKFDINAFHLKKMRSLSPNNSDNTEEENDSLSDTLQCVSDDDDDNNSEYVD